MTKDDILKKIQDILSEQFEINSNAVIPSAKLYDDLELDSIDAVDLLVKMKEFIPGKVDPEMFKKALTVQDVVELLYPMVHKA
ncbi:MAG: acyl carrier protein [Treponema sp.]|nr:acyl carrier protein [Treponema sp.]